LKTNSGSLADGVGAAANSLKIVRGGRKVRKLG
jgi:hypothetical protein